MIQAPIMPYVPQAQTPQMGFQQQGAYFPVQQQPIQLPGTIYNYPTASAYMPSPPALPRPQYNGVNIEILNPQGQGGLGIPQQNLIPAQFYPVAQQAVIPQAQVFQPLSPGMSYPNMTTPAYQPPQQVYQQQQVFPAYQPDASAYNQQNTRSQPNITPPVPPSPQIPADALQPAVQSPKIETQQPVVTPVIDQPAQIQQPAVDPATFAGRLRSNDVDSQRAAIEDVAEKVKNDDIAGPILLDTQVFDALVDIINKDTSYLPGPSPDVIELRQKDPQKLTPYEQSKIAYTPFEKAEINKQYALYTISYMQERLNNELEKRNGAALDLKDLPCIDTVVDTVKANSNPMLRIGAIAALSHIARPNYIEDLKTIFELAKSDEDERVREAADKAHKNIA